MKVEEINIITAVDDRYRKEIIDDSRCRVAGSDVSAAGAASLHQATDTASHQLSFFLNLSSTAVIMFISSIKTYVCKVIFISININIKNTTLNVY